MMTPHFKNGLKRRHANISGVILNPALKVLVLLVSTGHCHLLLFSANFTIYISKLEYLNPEESMCDLNLVVNFSELYILTTEDSPLGEGQNVTFESKCLLLFLYA